MSNNIYKHDNLIDIIIEYIKTHDKYHKLFNHFNQKYQIKDLFRAVFYKLSEGIPFRKLEDMKLNVKWNNVVYFTKKLCVSGLFDEMPTNFTNHYINLIGNKLTTINVDSTLIHNKLGSDNVTYNPQFKKHKSSKITIFVDNFNISIYSTVTSSNVHDAKVCNDHIGQIAKQFPNLCTNNIYVVGDAAYDSSNIRNNIADNNIGELVCPKNPRKSKKINKPTKKNCKRFIK